MPVFETEHGEVVELLCIAHGLVDVSEYVVQYGFRFRIGVLVEDGQHAFGAKQFVVGVRGRR